MNNSFAALYNPMSPVNDTLILYYMFAIYTLNIYIPYSGRDKENFILYIKRRLLLMNRKNEFWWNYSDHSYK